MTARFSSVDELVADARSRLHRLTPREALRRVRGGARIVDIRPAWLREREIPGALIVERNHLEWRLHPDSDVRLAAAVTGQDWIVVCVEGYTSSLAADALNSLGIDATDIDGGIEAWIAAGLPTVAGVSAVDEVVAGNV